MMRRHFLAGICVSIASCQLFEPAAQFTSGGAAAAAAIAAAGGQTNDAACWTSYEAVLVAAEQQASNGPADIIAPTIQLKRDFKAIAANYDCFGITVELLTAIAKIPYAGTAMTILGF